MGEKLTNMSCPNSLANIISYHIEIIHTTSVQFITNCEPHIYNLYYI